MKCQSSFALSCFRGNEYKYYVNAVRSIHCVMQWLLLCVRYCSSTDGVYPIRYISTVVFGFLVKAVGALKKYCNKVLKNHLKSLANIDKYKKIANLCLVIR